MWHGLGELSEPCVTSWLATTPSALFLTTHPTKNKSRIPLRTGWGPYLAIGIKLRCSLLHFSSDKNCIRRPVETNPSWLVLNHHISWGVSWRSCGPKEMMLPGRRRSPDEAAVGHDVHFVMQTHLTTSWEAHVGRVWHKTFVFVASSHGLFLPEMCLHTLVVDDGIWSQSSG